MTSILKRFLCVWGNAEHGRLGLGKVSGSEMLPQICTIADNVKTVCCGGAHTVVLAESGSVWSFGLNSEGQLGHSPNEDVVSVPTRVEIPEAVKTIAAGHYHTLCLTGSDLLQLPSMVIKRCIVESGRVYGFGSNEFGQLGIGDHAQKHPSLPMLVPEFNGIDVCCGASHSLGLVSIGEVYAWGSNQHGQLGYAKKLFSSMRQRHPRLIREIRDIRVKNLAAGHICSGCVDENGYAHTWGGNNLSQLGYDGESHILPQPKQVPRVMLVHKLLLGGNHAMCLLENGTAFVWGTNDNGGLGLGPRPSESQNLTGFENLPVDDRHAPEIPQGDALIGACIRAPAMLRGTKLIDGSLGWRHSAGVNSEGELLTWGWGGSMGEPTHLFEGNEGSGGQLGNGCDFDTWIPTKISPPQHTDFGPLRFRSVSCGLNHTAAVAEVMD